MHTPVCVWRARARGRHNFLRRSRLKHDIHEQQQQQRHPLGGRVTTEPESGEEEPVAQINKHSKAPAISPHIIIFIINSTNHLAPQTRRPAPAGMCVASLHGTQVITSGQSECEIPRQQITETPLRGRENLDDEKGLYRLRGARTQTPASWVSKEMQKWPF